MSFSKIKRLSVFIMWFVIVGCVFQSINGKNDDNMKSDQLENLSNFDICENIDALSYSKTGPIPSEKCFMGYKFENTNGEVVIDGVPSYKWHHGCGPTSVGMLVGYWHSHGYEDLVDGSATTQTFYANVMMATNEHYCDYCLPMDSTGKIKADKSEKPEGDEHPDNCVADFMKTSQSVYNLRYGASFASNIDDSIEDYCEWKSPKSRAIADYHFTHLKWEKYCEEINSDRPAILSVDSNGDGVIDHFVIGIGYKNWGDTPYYACYNTWDNDIHWYKYRRVKSGDDWGVGDGITSYFTNAPDKPEIPEGPSTIKPNEEKSFSTRTTESDGEQIYYKWDWGDNSSTDWIGPYTSNQQISISHRWAEKGSYEIKVKAKDEHGAEGEWSDQLAISITKNKILSISFILSLNNHPDLSSILNRVFG